MKKFYFSKWGFNYKQLSDMISVKAGPSMAFPNLLGKLKAIVGGRVSKSFFSICVNIHQQLKHILDTQGAYGLIVYLKAAQISLQQASSGYKVRDMKPFGAKVSRTKGSLMPRIVAAPHRAIILNNRPGKYLLIKFYLTLFYCYRVVEVPKYKVNLSTILNPGVDEPKQFIPSRYYLKFLNVFIKDDSLFLDPLKYLKEHARLFTILKSSPSNFSQDDQNLWSTHPLVMFRSLSALVGSNVFDAFQTLASSYFPKLQEFADNWTVNEHLVRMTKPGLPIGKLSFKEEAAGKLRVFALVDNFTQWLLYPLHKLIFSILKRIPMDGTFNQLRPVHRLLRKGLKEFYSLDLSAATDRLPLSIQSELLNRLIWQVPGFGDLWAKLLVGRPYLFKSNPSYDNSKHGLSGKVYYKVGQPMGALSSWAMLALTHHFLVQVSAWRIGWVKPGTLYTNYALLGDDLVVADGPVAHSYLDLMSKIGVAINLNKSILSPKGLGLEFAKRTFIEGVDVSPLSLRDLSLSLQPGAVSHWVAFSKAHNLSFLQQAHILGFGYQAISKAYSSLNNALKVVFLANIAKVDFNTDMINLVRKVPVDLDINLVPFRDSVLLPIRNDLYKEFGDEFVELSVEDRIHVTEASATDWVMDWISSHYPHMDFVLDKHMEISVQNGTPVEESVAWAEIHAFMNELHKEVVKAEAPRTFIQLREALDGLDLMDLYSLDQCLQAYLRVMRLRAISSIAALKLDAKIVRSVKLPYQVLMFRKWSRIVQRVVKDHH
jgi:hypothetical protein